MEFKHSVKARLYVKATKDYQIFELKNADLAEFDTPKLALAGVMTLLTNFLSTTITGQISAIQIFSQTDISKQFLITATARVRVLLTGKAYDVSYKFAHDTAAAYATYHSAGITALDNMIDVTLYAYDKASVTVEENPEYVPT